MQKKKIILVPFLGTQICQTVTYLTSPVVEAGYHCIPIFPKNLFPSPKYLNGLKSSKPC